MKNDMLYYSVGPLLYTPANNKGIYQSLLCQRFGTGFSLAFCLEDTIHDAYVEEAETIMADTLCRLWQTVQEKDIYIPKIFIRVREPSQIARLCNLLADSGTLVTGFIAPKFSLCNADDYIRQVLNASTFFKRQLYLMPILENPDIIHLLNRHQILYSLKERLDAVKELILNIRVGGNDLCHAFGFRRHRDESIHAIGPVAGIFSDIITVFGMDYIISGPVWEYYNGDGWQDGLIQELRDDRLCGFVGKTVIHPRQISLVNEAYKVFKEDYDDALTILHWDEDNPSLVSGSSRNERMNEYKTHYHWAQHTLMLAKVYGIRE